MGSTNMRISQAVQERVGNAIASLQMCLYTTGTGAQPVVPIVAADQATCHLACRISTQSNCRLGAMEATLEWVLIAACVGSGMMAGLFSAFSSFMMKALASLSDSDGIKAMQAINRLIVRPSFLLVFIGTGVLCAISVLLGCLD